MDAASTGGSPGAGLPGAGSPDDGSPGAAFAADLLRGHTDTIVLGVLRRHDSYGFEIHKLIREATGGASEIKEATLYASYRRLVRDGLAEAYWGDESQGGRRKYYRITDAGRSAFTQNVAAWVTTRGIIDSLLGTEPGSTKGSKR
ncbi:PadR family transcriptional regulator [Agromyces sp. CFH 90414]|uniref:PadR family transcriptional regulator n=2 Tax=Agromyces agglutinans TaxID=2662258 RepID=A0A6I2F2V6_9MICO|nr:PadR family transcriptional regulator [Agromyces agglutinans]